MTNPERPSWPADNPPSQRWPIYTRGNVGEVYPEVVLPLEWDIASAGSEQGWRDGAKHLGFLVESDFDDPDFDDPDFGDPDFDGGAPMTLIGVFGGYAYFNASLMRLLGVRTPGLSVDLIDTQFLGEADVPPYRRAAGDKNLKASAAMVRSTVKTLLARSVHLLDEMHERVDAHIAKAPPLDAPDDELWRYIKDGTAEIWPFLIGSHVINTMQATIAAGALADLCEAKLGNPDLALALTTGLGDVRSAQPATEMWVLANETADDDFDQQFAQFLERHGHRGPNEFSMVGRDWAAFPEIAKAAINSMRGASPERSPAQQLLRMQSNRQAAMADAEAEIGLLKPILRHLVKKVALWSRARELSKDEVIRALQPSRHALLELARRAVERGGDPDRVAPFLLAEPEFLRYLTDPKSMQTAIDERRPLYERLRSLEPPFAFSGEVPDLDDWKRRDAGSGAITPVAAGAVLTGAAGAPGVATGRARIITDPSDPTAIEEGDILIAPLTDPSWTPLFVAAGGVVVEVGAAMSHSMIVSRELGIPCVVGLAGAMRSIPDGTMITIDGQAGTVTIQSPPSAV